MTTKPVVIAGAGAAGLSLAVHLLDSGWTDPLVLVEPREHYRDDRTWCYWHFGDHPFEGCVSRRWRRWRLRAADRDVVSGSTQHPYCHIRGGDFYDHALERLRSHRQVHLELGARVIDVEDKADGVRVETTGGVIDGRYLFDSRPTPVADGLIQHFAGLFVRAEADVFDPSTPTLMDFQAIRPTVDGVPLTGVHFIYLLPFSAREALVESTLLTPRDEFSGLASVETGHVNAALAYLERDYPAAHVAVLRRERGAIPMAIPAEVRSTPSPDFPKRRSHRPSAVIPIGTAAGCARPSSGYAFDAIQRTSGAMARALTLGHDPRDVQVWRRRARWLDRIFLSFLESRPELAPSVFTSLFDHLPGDLMPRFLSDRESIPEVIRMMSAMPVGVFTREWLRVQTA
ncbi:MAG: lycopene cyclase family protein [Acidobacteriota bacterium]